MVRGPSEVDSPSVANKLLDTGEQLVYDFGGGGGWGDPLDRDPAAVLDDVWDEYVSVEGALTRLRRRRHRHAGGDGPRRGLRRHQALRADGREARA